MANKKRKIQIAAAMLMAFSLAACQSGGAGQGAKEEGAADEAAVEKSDDEVLDEYADSLKEILEGKFGENYKVERDGLFVNASVWKDGCAKLVEEASSDNQDSKKKWDGELEELQKLSEELGESIAATGVKNGHVVLSLMDEGNQQRMLAMLSDGTVIFDEVSVSLGTPAVANDEKPESPPEENTEISEEPGESSEEEAQDDDAGKDKEEAE